MEWAAAFGIEVKEPRKVTENYREALACLPVDLLGASFSSIKHAWTWRNMPLPGEVMRRVEVDYQARLGELGRLELAALRYKAPERVEPISDAQRAALRELIAAQQRRLRGAASRDDIEIINANRARHGLPPVGGDA